MDFEVYLDALASSEPTPGGGSAATLVGAMGAALCAMVARITLGHAKRAAVHPAAEAIAREADGLRARFLAARPRDEAAFAAVIAAQGLPRGTPDETAARTAALQAALIHAAEVPLAAAALAAETATLAERTAQLGNAGLMSDVDCALRFARAAREASAANVAVNHRYIKDAAVIAEQRARLQTIESTASAAETRALELVLTM